MAKQDEKKKQDDKPPVAPKLPDGHVWIDVLTEAEAGTFNAERRSIPATDKAFNVLVDGVYHEHVSDAPDGAWQFRKK